MQKTDEQVFTKRNYLLLLIAIALMLIGFIILGVKNPTSDPESIFYKYSFLKLTIGPILISIAFILVVISIFRK